MKQRRNEKNRGASVRVLKRLRNLCLTLPETSERDSWGHPNFVAGHKTFVTFEFIDLRPSIAFRMDSLDVQEMARNEAFFATPYGRGQWVSLWADAKLDWPLINKLVRRSYRLVALRRMIEKLPYEPIL
jgi:predicted DNA-binding protein (MmcQ/YjbR family)